MKQQDLDMELEMIAQLKQRISRHDFSYMMSDDNRAYMAGMVNEKNIANLIHPLCTIHRIDAEALMNEVLAENAPQFTDFDNNGDDLTHRVIKSWFTPFVEMDHIVHDFDTTTAFISKPTDKLHG